jgi:hypothetical protein
MISFCDNNDKNANASLTLKHPSISSSSDDAFLSYIFEMINYNLNEPPMHQPLDLEEQEQMQEWEEPSMCQPSET